MNGEYGKKLAQEAVVQARAALNASIRDADSPKIDDATKQALLEQCDQFDTKIGGKLSA